MLANADQITDGLTRRSNIAADLLGCSCNLGVPASHIHTSAEQGLAKAGSAHDLASCLCSRHHTHSLAVCVQNSSPVAELLGANVSLPASARGDS